MSLKLEDELDLEEEARELEPLFSRGEAIVQPYRGKQWGPTIACPRPTRVTVSGFPQYSNSVELLPGSEQVKIRKIAKLIIRSFRPRSQPIVAVRLVGHADFDPLSERREAGFMMRSSRARALAVKRALERLINNRAISSRIAWDLRGVGASQLAVRNPTTEAGRRHNRRVEIGLSGNAGAREFEGPTPLPRPAPNAVDPEAAEPVFSGRVRTPEAPLLDAGKLKSASRWNQAMHPKASGITLAELRARLERYLDRAALDDLVHRANTGMPGPYGSDEATLVTLLAHQFQRKTCRTPTVGDVTKPCTADGRVAEDTLDALGFVYHGGKSLNVADRSNSAAATALGRVPASAFTGIEPSLTAKTWWSSMVSPPWLGLPIRQGIHLILLKRLRRAQHALMNLPAYANLSPAELGRALGLEEEHKGARPSTAGASMHLFGLAIDIGFARNPWMTNPKGNPAKVAAITLRAARLVGPPGASERGITARYLSNLGIAHRDTEKIHKILGDWSRWLGEYFALAEDAKRLQSLLPLANAIYPDAGWFKPGESLAAAATRWTRVVRADFDDFAVAVSRGGTGKNEVRQGFMDLARDLVIALRDEACLGWGAVDFGPAASGDVMHFDCRVEGIGRAIAKTSGGPFVPISGHPCLPAGSVPSAQHEFELEAADAPSPPQGGWIIPKKVTTAFPKYKDATGDMRHTDYSIYLSTKAVKESEIDLLLFLHGDPGPCEANFDPDPKNTKKKFGIDAQIERSKPALKIVLVIPQLFWIPHDDKNPQDDENIKGIWTAANLNRFIEDSVLAEIEKKSGLKPKIKRLIIAGHSHACAILTPLAFEFINKTEATKKGALASLKEVWALDSTYGEKNAHALEIWANKLPNCNFTAVLNKEPAKKGKKKKPIDGWNSSFADHKLPSNLIMLPVPNGHCEIPQKCIEDLLSGMPR
jgi:hypothetical protein